jgi:D-alanyl-D-alanine carboxypeptidase
MTVPFRVILLGVMAAACSVNAQLPPAEAQKIDGIVTKVLGETAAPSVSLAVVKDGQIAYAKAYGNAHFEPETSARLEMRYSIGSVSKQFLAAAILILAQDGKLSRRSRGSLFAGTHAGERSHNS